MKIIDEKLNGLKVIQLNIFADERGFFTERFKKSEFEKIGIKNEFVQDNFSHSKAGVVRGLHYQRTPDQAKLVGCTRGKILDVAVDIRKNSPTFGQYFAIELSGENGLMLFVPAGFAHGFSALTEADVLYKVDGPWNKAGEGGIIFNDREFDINWQVAKPLVSVKDLELQSFANYKKSPVF